MRVLCTKNLNHTREQTNLRLRKFNWRKGLGPPLHPYFPGTPLWSLHLKHTRQCLHSQLTHISRTPGTIPVVRSARRATRRTRPRPPLTSSVRSLRLKYQKSCFAKDTTAKSRAKKREPRRVRIAQR